MSWKELPTMDGGPESDGKWTLQCYWNAAGFQLTSSCELESTYKTLGPHPKDM